MREDLGEYIEKELEQKRLEKEQREKEEAEKNKEQALLQTFSGHVAPIETQDLELLADVGFISHECAKEYLAAYDAVRDSFETKSRFAYRSSPRTEAIAGTVMGGAIGTLFGAMFGGIFTNRDTTMQDMLPYIPYVLGIPALILGALFGYGLGKESKQIKNAYEKLEQRFNDYSSLLYTIGVPYFEDVGILTERLEDIEEKYDNVGERLHRARVHFAYHRKVLADNKADFENILEKVREKTGAA